MAVMKEIYELLQRLKDGNEKYLTAKTALGNISPEIRAKTARNGQKPYAVIITCSDSRVIPENIFSTGIGDLFVIRTAGNTIDKATLGSIEYAVEHLGVKLVVVMGHTQCGAVRTVLGHEEVHGNLKEIIDENARAIGAETDSNTAVKLNIKNGCKIIENAGLPAMTFGAVYNIETGHVEFLGEGNSD